MGVRTVRRAGGEHAGERERRVAVRMHLEHAAIRLVQPGEEDELVADREMPGGEQDIRRELDPGIRRALVALHRSAAPVDQDRADPADRAQQEVGGTHLVKRAFISA